MSVVDAIRLIVYFRTSPLEAALKALRSKEAARTRVALRLRRRRSSLLYLVAERAAYLEALGVDRATATRELAEEFRVRLEEEMRRAREVMNFVVYAVAMLYFAAAIGFILGMVSEAGVALAYAMYIATAGPLAYLEAVMRPARRWPYHIAALATAPALLAGLWPPIAILTVPVAVAYGAWYWRGLQRALDEVRLAMRMRAAETDLGRQLVEVARAVRESGALDLEATAEHLLRLYYAYLEGMRKSALARALVVVAVFVVLVAALATLSANIAPIVEKAQGAPIRLYTVDIKPLVYAAAIAGAVAAGRLTESYAAVPLYTPMTLALLFV